MEVNLCWSFQHIRMHIWANTWNKILQLLVWSSTSPHIILVFIYIQCIFTNFIYAGMYTYIQTNVCEGVCVFCMYVFLGCMCVYRCTYIMYISVPMCMYMRVPMCTYMRAPMCMYMYVPMCMYMHVHMHMCMQVHVCVWT